MIKTKREYIKPSATVITIDFGSSLLVGSQHHQIEATTEDVGSDTELIESKSSNPFTIYNY